MPRPLESGTQAPPPQHTWRGVRAACVKSPAVPDAIDLDHVAIGLRSCAPAWDLFAHHLGGRWIGGGTTAGFASAQVAFANGMKVEALEPANVHLNDFLVRFLDRSGNGPHHLTYKVPNIVAELERCRSLGYEPVGIDLRDAHWKEAFLHPKASHGIVIQLAESDGDWDGGPRPASVPDPLIDPPATLVHVCHAVADLDAALEMFKGLLGGVTLDAGAGSGTGWVDLGWPGPGRVRLVAGHAVAPWLDGRTGRMHHIAFRHPDPASVPGAAPIEGALDDDLWRIEPDEAVGTRVVLAGPGSDPDHFVPTI